MAEDEKKDIDNAEEVKKEDAKGDDAEEKKEGGDAENGKDAEGGEEGDKKKSGGMMKIILFAGVPVLLIIIIAVVLFFTSFGRGLIGLETDENLEEEVVEEAVMELPEHISYYDMPELLVNIQSSTSKRKPYLRLAVKFELHDPEAMKTLDIIKPRIIDSFQIYLRELRVDDLEGSAGSQRLKEELLKRVNAVAAPLKIVDVLFQVFVIQ